MNNEIDIKDQSQTYQWRRGFWSLFVLQFQGAFSDSVFKFLIVFLITQSITEEVLQSEFPVQTAQTIELSESVQKKQAKCSINLINSILIVASRISGASATNLLISGKSSKIMIQFMH